MAEGERDVALQAVRQGYVAIAPDVRAFADLRRREELEKDATSSCRTLQMHALLFGRTLVGERVWDMGRAICHRRTAVPQVAAEDTAPARADGVLWAVTPGGRFRQIAMLAIHSQASMPSGPLESILASAPVDLAVPRRASGTEVPRSAGPCRPSSITLSQGSYHVGKKSLRGTESQGRTTPAADSLVRCPGPRAA